MVNVLWQLSLPALTHLEAWQVGLVLYMSQCFTCKGFPQHDGQCSKPCLVAVPLNALAVQELLGLISQRLEAVQGANRQ